MFEGGNMQNGTQSNDQSSSPAPYGFRSRPSALDDTSMPDQISSGKMFDAPQPGGTGDADFVNWNLLRIDPQTGIAYRPPAVPGDAASLSPSARQLGDLAAGAGRTVRDPTTVLQEQLAEYGKPIPIRDSQGKMNPKYRMGIGHRILATVANFANGFAGNHAPPIYVGPGAVNHRYYEDEATRQQNLESVERQLSTQTPATQPQKAGKYTGQNTGAGDPPPENNKLTGTSGLTGMTPAALALQSPRQRFAQLRAARRPNWSAPLHRAFNPQTGEYIGSNDGTNWFPTSPGSALS